MNAKLGGQTEVQQTDMKSIITRKTADKQNNKKHQVSAVHTSSHTKLINASKKSISC